LTFQKSTKVGQKREYEALRYCYCKNADEVLVNFWLQFHEIIWNVLF